MGPKYSFVLSLSYKYNVQVLSLNHKSTFVKQRFSGISEEDVTGHHTSLSEVQETLLSFISADTILIGHSLEMDLCALKVIKISFLQRNQSQLFSLTFNKQRLY